VLLRRTLADQIAEDDQPGGDPDPHLQPHLGCAVDLRDRPDQGQPCANRELGIVLVGPG
jgi:hypothetical protein